MHIINSEINLMLTWSSQVCVFPNGTKTTTFAIADTKRYVPVAISST